jgi:phenylacetate-CoA ligase
LQLRLAAAGRQYENGFTMSTFRSDQAQRATRALSAFYDADIEQLLHRHLQVSPEAKALEHFHSVAREVPAYKRFLAAARIDADSVATQEDFKRLPLTTKDNYQRAHAFAELCRFGELDRCDMLAVSSGSTGEPTFWPRFVSDEIGTAMRFEQVLHDAMRCDEKSTLGVICFALGNWVGGMYTTACCRHIAAKGYPLTVVTPGNNKPEILRVVRALGDHYEQVVLFGYPPFLKDVIDAGRVEGFDWSRRPTRLVMAGEVFSEEWRQLVCDRLGAGDPAHATASLYGTADGGVLANETPLSIRIRRFLAEHPRLAHELFGESRLPTLCQYDPLHRFFEQDGGELVFSGESGAPLVRYKILDRGGVIPYATMQTFLAGHGFDPSVGLTPQQRRRVREQPFVFVFGRANFAVSYYGANIFPENVSVGLEQPEFAAAITGKFVMQIGRDADLNAHLEITIEQAPGVEAEVDLVTRLQASIQKHLERLNSEFANYVPAPRRTPPVQLAPHAHPDYFPPGVKHRYTRGS